MTLHDVLRLVEQERKSEKSRAVSEAKIDLDLLLNRALQSGENGFRVSGGGEVLNLVVNWETGES